MTEDQSRKRARRDKRSATPPAIRLTERDLKLIQAVYEYRLLSTQHIQTLFFPSAHQTYGRLALLYQHGFLDRKFMGAYTDKMNRPILYVLDRRGAELLQAELGIDVTWSSHQKQVSLDFLEHTLAINTVRVAIAKACEQNPDIKLLKWLGESDLKKDYDRVTIRSEAGKQKSVSVIPDSYFVLDTPKGVAHFFLELDRGTMKHKTYKQKILAYLAYYASGAYQRRFNTQSLRILTVTVSQTRVENLLKTTEEAQGKQRFWFTALGHLTPQTVLSTPIWQVATKAGFEILVDVSAP